MLSNMFIYWIGLAAIQAAKSQVIIDPVSCAPYAHTMKFSLNEMIDMSNETYRRTQSFWTPNTPVNELRVVRNTFDAYFAININNIQQAQDAGREVSYILDTLRNISTLNRQIIIYCDESFLVKGAGVFRNRYYIRGTNPKVQVDPNCDQGGLRAYSLPIQKIITLCPGLFTHVRPELETAKSTNFTNDTDYTYVSNMRSISSTILHELLHHLFTSSMYWGDDEVYGNWNCRRLVQAHPGQTLHQPDCIMLYAICLYLSLNDWSAGWATS